MKLQYDLIALDVDGTLLTDDHQLRDDVREAVRQAKADGAEIVICTGRGPVGALPVMEQLGLGGAVITHNGAAAVNSEDRSLLFQYELDPGQLTAFIDYSRENRVHYDLSTAFEMMLDSITDEAREMYAHHGVSPILREEGAELPAGLVKFTVFGPKDQIDTVQQHWEAWTPSLATIRSGDLFIDVQHPDSSKGNALTQLAAKLGIESRRILAIGNYYNDVSMLQFAGMGVAMSNSPDEVKLAANAVTGSNNEGGVAAALRKYAWL